MSAENAIQEPAKRTIVARVEGADRVDVERDVPFRAADGQPLAFDLYRPLVRSGKSGEAVVVLVPGYPDPGFERFVGCRFKEMGSSVSWARAIAACGMAAVVPTNRAPEADLCALFAAVRARREELRLDTGRIGLWASSGNGPLALSLLLRPANAPGSAASDRPQPRCVALLYPFLLDLAGDTAVARAAATWRFANPGSGRELADLSRETPILVVRAGADEMPELNASLDRFVVAAVAAGLPLSLQNVPGAEHAFDLADWRPIARAAIRQVLGFLRLHLLDEVARRES